MSATANSKGTTFRTRRQAAVLTAGARSNSRRAAIASEIADTRAELDPTILVFVQV